MLPAGWEEESNVVTLSPRNKPGLPRQSHAKASQVYGHPPSSTPDGGGAGWRGVEEWEEKGERSQYSFRLIKKEDEEQNPYSVRTQTLRGKGAS